MDLYMNIQDVWTTTDEKLIHVMQNENEKSENKNFNHVITSSEESSSSDSDSSSENSFVALRQEFRPNLTVRKSPAVEKRSLEQTTLNQNAPVSNLSLKNLQKCFNEQASPNANSLPVLYETPIKTFLSKTKENSMLEQVGKTEKIEKQLSEADEDAKPEDTDQFVEVMNNGSKVDKPYNANKLQRNGKNLVSGNSRITLHSRAPETSSYKKGAEFHITVSEHIEVSHTRIIEIDVAQLSSEKSTTAEIKNNVPPRFQEKLENMKKHSRNQNRNEICTNYRKHKKTSSQNNSPNLYLEGEHVKWNSTLDLSSINHSFEAFSFVNTTTGGAKSKKKINNKIKWTTTEGGKIQTSVTRSSSNKINMTQQLTYNNKIKDVKYNKKCYMEPSVPKNESRQVKLNDVETDFQNNQNSDNFIKQNRGQIIWEAKCPPHQDLHRNSSEESEKLNENFQWHSDYKDENDYHSITRIEKCKTCCCSGLNKDQKFQPNKDTEKIKYDHFENRSHQMQQDLVSDRKILNSERHSQNIFNLGQKNSLIEYGKEISDLIVGSHVAMSTFFSFYTEWKISRCELIHQFEQMDRNIIETSKRYNKYQDMFKVLSGFAQVTANIPVPYIAMGSKIVAFFSSLAMQIFGKSDGSKVDMDVPEIITSLLQDINVSSDLFMYGLLCNQQLEETIKLIEKFHTKAMNHEFDNECSDREILIFMQSLVDFSPKHRTFYKKLHKSFQELLQKESPFCKRFCEPFQFGSSDSVDVIRYLDWRFENINNDSVKNELEQIHCLIQNNDSTKMTDLAARVENCIRILKNELKSADRCVSTVSLFHTSFETLKLDSK